MKIIMMKKAGKNKYKLTFDNKEQIALYEDVVINNLLLVNKFIDSDMLSEIKKQDFEISAYYQALKYINFRQRSKKEIEIYLDQKGYDDYLISKAVDRLLKEGYINDERFAESFINDRLYLSKDGIDKIRKQLENYGLSDQIIDRKINNVDQTEWQNKMIKVIDKMLKNNHSYSGNVLRNKILNNLINLGYEQSMIMNYLENVSFEDKKNLKKEYDKLYNKYSKKYSGYQLQMIIKQKLYQKGYNSIDEIIEK